MRYRNPQLPEGINVSDRHPLKEFVLLAGGAVMLIVLLGWLLGQFGGGLARLLPFEQERSIAPDSLLHSDAGPELQAYLDRLAARVSTAMKLPPGIQVQLHFSGGETFNAFATLGGNVLLYRGLVGKLPHENALVMLLAHEIAHVMHRDPIAGLGQGVAIQLVFGMLFGDPNLAVLGSSGLYSQLQFTRAMERDADAAALRTVHALYGHVAGAQDLFRVIQDERRSSDGGEPPALFNSHPLDRQRVQAIDDMARANGWSTRGETTALPDGFAAWMDDAAHTARTRPSAQRAVAPWRRTAGSVVEVAGPAVRGLGLREGEAADVVN